MKTVNEKEQWNSEVVMDKHILSLFKQVLEVLWTQQLNGEASLSGELWGLASTINYYDFQVRMKHRLEKGAMAPFPGPFLENEEIIQYLNDLGYDVIKRKKT